MYKNQYEQGTTHAEENAIKKLPVLPRKRKLKKVDMLVVRTNKEGLMGSSKPCANCLLAMKQRLPEKGYTLGTVYFSEAGGTINHAPFHRLLEDKDGAHMSRYYKGRNLIS